MANNTSNGPRIYVASLADYNAGNLHGVWIDLDGKDEDEIQTEIAAMLRASKHPNVMVDCPHLGLSFECPRATADNSPCATCKGTGKVPSAEEWSIHDHEGFEGIKIGENPDLENVVMHAKMIGEHDGAWAAYVGVVGEHYATEDGFSDAYQGEFDSAEAYAEDLIENCYDLKSMGNLANYIDYEKFARDLTFDGYHFVAGGCGVYVINGNA